MLKYLLLAVLAGLVWLAWKKSRQNRAVKPPVERPVETMVVCRHCGVHLPAGEALADGDRTYCCEAHRAADRQ